MKETRLRVSHRRIKNSRADRLFYGANGIIMFLLFLLYAWPLWFVLIASFSNPDYVTTGQVLLLPKGFHLGGYELILEYQDILRGYFNSILYTVFGTALNLLMTICAAYPLSRRDFMPRRILTVLFVFTMYFSGGLIPTFLQVKNLGLYDSPLAMIIPSAVSMYNVLILRSFFMYGIPKSLEEAAVLDGANSFSFLTRIAIPLVKPTLAVLTLYYAVARYNDFFNAMLYLGRRELEPLQLFLRKILLLSSSEILQSSGSVTAVAAAAQSTIQVRYVCIVLAVIPILIICPFVQKYLVKGTMLGAVKG